MIPFYQDGASGYFPFEARRPTLPGDEAVYEFDLIQSGTLMYHTGFNLMKQEGLGVGGLFVVHPREWNVKMQLSFMEVLAAEAAQLQLKSQIMATRFFANKNQLGLHLVTWGGNVM